MKENSVCSVCGAKLKEEEAKNFDGKTMCLSCFDEHTVACDDCGTRVWQDEAEGNDHRTLCYDCYSRYYTTCESCGELIRNDEAYYEDDYPYCHSCYQKLEDKAIKSYNYKPDPIFFGSGNLFMGVELEVDKGGECDDSAQVLLDSANLHGERIYCKHDGSISDGFEIVSHPMTLEYHTDKMNWEDILGKAVDMGYRSHDTSTCGLHIHCNRSAFGETYENQEKIIGRIVFFFEKHWLELVRFSRRTPDNLNHWAARYATISTSTEETYKKAKDKRLGRYVAVNLENDETVEFRMFRGTLCYRTFLACLELIDEICYHAINMTDAQMEGMSWSDFVSRILPKKYELIEYLKSKRLYVNDFIGEGAER